MFPAVLTLSDLWREQGVARGATGEAPAVQVYQSDTPPTVAMPPRACEAPASAKESCLSGGNGDAPPRVRGPSRAQDVSKPRPPTGDAPPRAQEAPGRAVRWWQVSTTERRSPRAQEAPGALKMCPNRVHQQRRSPRAQEAPGAPFALPGVLTLRAPGVGSLPR